MERYFSKIVSVQLTLIILLFHTLLLGIGLSKSAEFERVLPFQQNWDV